MLNKTLLEGSELVWKHNEIDDKLTMLYGFKTDLKYHKIVLTLYKILNKTLIHGFLSRISLTPKDFWSLWMYMSKIIKTKYVVFEVFKEHAIVYKKYIPVSKVEKIRTFDGYDAELLTVDLGD